jgi:predicted RND superfamily exporter protein
MNPLTQRLSHLRENIEQQFGHWGSFAYRHPWRVLAPIMIMTAGLYSFLPSLQIDTTMESFFHDEDPTRVYYNEFRHQYGRDDTVMVAVETPEVFTAEFLTRLTQFHHALENEVPLVNEVRSLVNARHTIGNAEGLVVNDFLEGLPENISDITTEDLGKLKAEALANPFYVGNYVSKDSRMAVLVVENENFHPQEADTLAEAALAGFEESAPESPAPKTRATFAYLNEHDNTAILQGFDDVKAKYETEDFRISMSGGPYTTAWFLDTVKNNMGKFTGLAVLIVMILLYAIFRRWIMVFVPVGVALLSMLAAMSLMAAMEYRLSFSMQIVPSFLLAVGVGNCVHVFTVFFQAIARGDNKEEALVYAMQHSGLAILMTGLTTAGSLLSFTVSDMKPIAEFGIMTPIGVLFALFFSLVLLPAIIAVFPIKLVAKQENEPSLIRKALVSCGVISNHYPLTIVLFWLALCAAGIYYATQLKFSFHVYDNLPPDHFLLEATKKVDEQMSGSGPLELVFDSGKPGGVKDPQFLKRLEQIYGIIEKYGFKKAISIVDINKELHQALNENDPAYYAIPDDPQLVAQELLLFENSGAEDLEKMVDSQFRYARLTLIGPMQDGIVLEPLLDNMLVEIQGILGSEHSVNSTGILRLSVEIFTNMQYTMAWSYIISFLIITPLMVLLIGSLRVGLVSMLPNMAPIIITLGVMGGTDIYLTGATLLTGSIAIGLVVDDTIHFMHNFQRYFARCGNCEQAIRQTLESTGQAIFFTSAILSSAFFIFMLNEVLEWANFGFITGLCIIVALLADIFLAPALVTLLFRKKQTH